MNTEKMTVHRALAELKTIDSRIDKAIDKATFCFANKHSNNKVKGVELKNYVDIMKNDFKSIKTLINRRNAMKRAVCLSNAITEVEINGVKYRVAEAIEMKNHGMENYQILKDSIGYQIQEAEMAIAKYNGDNLQQKADDYVQGLFGSRDKVSGTEAETTRKAYIDANTYDFVDPLQAKETYNDLIEMIDGFNAEVDAALSVSNAITEIEFSYEVE